MPTKEVVTVGTVLWVGLVEIANEEVLEIEKQERGWEHSTLRVIWSGGVMTEQRMWMLAEAMGLHPTGKCRYGGVGDVWVIPVQEVISYKVNVLGVE